MWPFGPDIDTLVSDRDIPRLWKRLRKEPTKQDTFLQFADDAWDYVYAWWLDRQDDKRATRNVEMLAFVLVKGGKAYAGTDPITPVEWLSRIERTYYGSKRKEEALCPVCNEYLAEPPIKEEKGAYRACKHCERRYHRECAAGIGSCRVCGHSDWKWDLRRG